MSRRSILGLALVLGLAACAHPGPAPLGAVDPGAPQEVSASKERVAEWRAFLAAQRKSQIQRLEDYSAAGSFAMNDDQPGLRFVWRDDLGRLCAMAHLVQASGNKDLVDQVAREHNDLQLVNVKDGSLHEWMLRSGLTIEEIQLVQEPGFRVPQKQASWEISRKRDHLRATAERLRLDTEASLDAALARLGDRIRQAPPTA